MEFYHTLARLAHRLNRIRLWLTRPITIGVRVLLVKDGGVILVRHTYQAGWLLPGGGVQRGETPEQAARREVREETGIEMGLLRLQGVFTNFHEYKSDHVVVFSCEEYQPTGAPRPAWEIAAVQAFPLDRLPAGLLPGHSRRIEDYLQGNGTPKMGIW